MVEYTGDYDVALLTPEQLADFECVLEEEYDKVHPNWHPDKAQANAKSFNLAFFDRFVYYPADPWQRIVQSPNGLRIVFSRSKGLEYEITNEAVVAKALTSSEMVQELTAEQKVGLKELIHELWQHVPKEKK